jgi:hypothetical protein
MCHVTVVPLGRCEQYTAATMAQRLSFEQRNWMTLPRRWRCYWVPTTVSRSNTSRLLPKGNLEGWSLSTKDSLSLRTRIVTTCHFVPKILTIKEWVHFLDLYMDPHFLTSSLVRSRWLASRASCFTRGERAHSVHWTGGRMGSRAGLDNMQKCKFFTLSVIEVRYRLSSHEF